MSFARALMASTYPYAMQAPDAPAAPAAPPAAPPAAAPPAAAPAASPPAATPPIAGGGAPPAPAAPAAPAAPPATIAAGGGTPPAVAVPAKFPESWRQDLAGEDKDFLKQLERFESPASLAKSYRELQTKLSSGELKAAVKPPPADAKPEEVAAWRKEQGLPEKAEDYVTGLKLPDGVIPGAADKPLLDSFAAHALGKNWTGQQYADAVGWYFGLQDQLTAQRQQADTDFMQEATVELTREWGQNFKANQTAVTTLWDAHLPKDFTDAMLNARLPDGSVLGNHPVFNKAFLEVAKIINPAATLLPNVAGAGLSNVESRIAEIEGKHMRATQGSDAWKAYWQGDAGAKMQEELRGLYGARETMAARGKAA